MAQITASSRPARKSRRADGTATDPDGPLLGVEVKAPPLLVAPAQGLDILSVAIVHESAGGDSQPGAGQGHARDECLNFWPSGHTAPGNIALQRRRSRVLAPAGRGGGGGSPNIDTVSRPRPTPGEQVTRSLQQPGPTRRAGGLAAAPRSTGATPRPSCSGAAGSECGTPAPRCGAAPAGPRWATRPPPRGGPIAGRGSGAWGWEGGGVGGVGSGGSGAPAASALRWRRRRSGCGPRCWRRCRS